MLALMLRMRRLIPVLTALALVALGFSGPALAQGAQPEDVSDVVAAVQQMRAEAGLPFFVLDEELRRAAQRHSLDMAANGELLHVSARTGDPARRVADEGLSPERVAENVARASTVLGAQDSIVGSAAHRAQIVDPELTHIGIAAARAPDGSVYLTQVMARLDAPEADEAPQALLVPVGPPTPVAAPVAPPPATAPPLPRGVQPAPALPQPLTMAPAASGVVTAPATGATQIAGYWVFSNGRWYYYPVPPGAQPGQQLTPDLSVQGPPPGYAGYGVSLPSAPPVSTTIWATPRTVVTRPYVAPRRRHFRRRGVRVVRPAPMVPGGRVIIYSR